MGVILIYRIKTKRKEIISMSKLTEMNKKIEEGVVGGYKKIEEGVVSSYKKVESGAVEGFQKITDKFVDAHLKKEGESLKDAKERITAENKERDAKVKQDIANIQKEQEELVKKNLEASLNAGKR